MAETITQYKYQIDLKLVTKDGKATTIPNNGIKYMVTNYDYENNNMPIIIISLNISSKLYTKVTLNNNTANMILTVKKYNAKSSTSVKKNYINEEFKYFLSETDGNPTEELDDDTINKETADAAYKNLTIGLLSEKLLKRNKHMINGVYKQTNNISLVYHAIKHMGSLIIEPFDYNDTIDSIIVPPMTSVSKIIEYLNRYNAFYKSGYIFFEDFKYTYLISTNGKAIDLKDGSYNNIIIDINRSSTKNDKAQITGMVVEKKNKLYHLYLDSSNSNLNIDKTVDKMVNRLVGVTSMGKVRDVNLDLTNTLDGTRYLFERIPNENKEYQRTLRSELENNAAIVTINTTEIDSSLITPNRRYSIKTFKGYTKYQGNYLLALKKEVFMSQDNDFTMMVTIGLRKKS